MIGQWSKSDLSGENHKLWLWLKQKASNNCTVRAASYVIGAANSFQMQVYVNTCLKTPVQRQTAMCPKKQRFLCTSTIKVRLLFISTRDANSSIRLCLTLETYGCKQDLSKTKKDVTSPKQFGHDWVCQSCQGYPLSESAHKQCVSRNRVLWCAARSAKMLCSTLW